ncbi:hypothetical protein [Streptomyces sp. NPDC096351]|uniref:hypothetical protein n=1 Tax=Streptomyces sp. NPDC096351 TaxID=3366087 RepID=UPI003830570A
MARSRRLLRWGPDGPETPSPSWSPRALIGPQFAVQSPSSASPDRPRPCCASAAGHRRGGREEQPEEADPPKMPIHADIAYGILGSQS